MIRSVVALNFLLRFRKSILVLVDAWILISTLAFVNFLHDYFMQTPVGDYLTWRYVLLLLLIYYVVFKIFNIYESLWRYAAFDELKNLIIASSLSAVIFYAVQFVLQGFTFVTSLYILTVTLANLLMIIYRLAYRRYRAYKNQTVSGCCKKLLIVGAGDAGSLLIKEIIHETMYNEKQEYELISIFDDDPHKWGRLLHGVKVFGPISALPEACKKIAVDEIIIAIPSLSTARRKEIVDICRQTGCRVRILPDLALLLSRESKLLSAVRNIDIEDLLGRETISLDNPNIFSLIHDQVVLVTGGGGSIGSELCRQIAYYKPRKLIILDIYENTAYDLQQELLDKFENDLDLIIEIASVQDVPKMEALFREYSPQVVFHAAAHKHVPLMENAPIEAVENNIFGTYNVAKIACKYDTKNFIFISTDKAVNPSSIMGATKNYGEVICQAMNTLGPTKFCSVRFGNVLGSHGSVIPLFQRQIAQGIPIKITHPEISRYFMTIPEAVSLIMQAATISKGGEIFILDMGEPIKILDLAEKLITLSGLVPYVDIPIIFTNLRPGEKLHEELFKQKETVSKTMHDRVFISQPPQISMIKVYAALDSFKEAINNEDRELLINVLKKEIPCYQPAEEASALCLEQEREEEQDLISIPSRASWQAKQKLPQVINK